MKKCFIFVTVMVLLTFMNRGFAQGNWNIVVTQVGSGYYIAMLKSTYSDYYDETVKGEYASFSEAESAAQQTRTRIYDSGVHAKPANCFFQSDLI